MFIMRLLAEEKTHFLSHLSVQTLIEWSHFWEGLLVCCRHVLSYGRAHEEMRVREGNAKYLT